MDSTAHDCPADGCTRRVAAHMLACRPHWFMIPAPLRSAVWDAWAGGLGAGSAAHRHAITEAIGALNDKIRERAT